MIVLITPITTQQTHTRVQQRLAKQDTANEIDPLVAISFSITSSPTSTISRGGQILHLIKPIKHLPHPLNPTCAFGISILPFPLLPL